MFSVIFIFGVLLVAINGQLLSPYPIAFPIDTIGTAASAFAGISDVPLLSPLELNAIMEAQSMQPYKTFPDERSHRKLRSNFMADFDSGYGPVGDFYESPLHGEQYPSGPIESEYKSDSKGKGDKRGRYHKDEGSIEGDEAEPMKPNQGRGAYREYDDSDYRDEEPQIYRDHEEGGYHDREPTGYREQEGKTYREEDERVHKGPEGYEEEERGGHYDIPNHQSSYKHDKLKDSVKDEPVPYGYRKNYYSNREKIKEEEVPEREPYNLEDNYRGDERDAIGRYKEHSDDYEDDHGVRGYKEVDGGDDYNDYPAKGRYRSQRQVRDENYEEDEKNQEKPTVANNQPVQENDQHSGPELPVYRDSQPKERTEPAQYNQEYSPEVNENSDHFHPLVNYEKENNNNQQGYNSGPRKLNKYLSAYPTPNYGSPILNAISKPDYDKAYQNVGLHEGDITGYKVITG